MVLYTCGDKGLKSESRLRSQNRFRSVNRHLGTVKFTESVPIIGRTVVFFFFFLETVENFLDLKGTHIFHYRLRKSTSLV